ncbi:hypothetical protein MYU51_010487 [Penicillium brevicompactum]
MGTSAHPSQHRRSKDPASLVYAHGLGWILTAVRKKSDKAVPSAGGTWSIGLILAHPEFIEEYRLSAPAAGSRWRADLEKEQHVVDSRFPKEAEKVSCDGMTENHRELCYSPAICGRELAVFEIAKVP